jgi:hypothetical protein
MYGNWEQNQICYILLEFVDGDDLELVDGGTLEELFQSQHPADAHERLSFWRNMVPVLEPLARFRLYPNLNESQRLGEG